MQKLLAVAATVAYTEAGWVNIPKAPAGLFESRPDSAAVTALDGLWAEKPTPTSTATYRPEPVGGACQGGCRRTCQSTGCNGCCQAEAEPTGNFFNKAVSKGCCAASLCPCTEVNPAPLERNEHEHSYCHLDTTPKFGKKTIWKEKEVPAHRPVQVQRKFMTTKTVIDYKVMDVPSIKHGTKHIQRTKTRLVPGTRTVTTFEAFTIQEPKQKTEMKEETYTEMQTAYRTGSRQVKKVRMVPKVSTRDVVEYESVLERVPTSEWRTNRSMTTRALPPVNRDPLGGDSGNCSCFKSACSCLGQTGCGCCFPTCGCAPQDTKEYETVQVLTETAVEMKGTKQVVTRVPRIEEREYSTMVPEEYFDTEEYQEPFLAPVTKSRMVPTVVTVMVPKEMTRPVETVVPYDEAVEYVVSEEVPYSEPVTTQVRVPYTKEVQVEAFDTITQREDYMLVLKYPEVTTEALPAQTVCHEHKMSHSHKLAPGETHTHSEEHAHPHTGENANYMGRAPGMADVTDYADGTDWSNNMSDFN